MGLFGVFAAVFTGGAFLIDTFKDAKYDGELKDKARKENSLTWTDSHGREYMLSTGKRVYRHDGKIKSVKTGQTLADSRMDRIKRENQERINKAIKEGKKFADLYYPEFKNRFYYTELSTMKRYYLYGDTDYDGIGGYYVKCYYNDNEAEVSFGVQEKEEITQEEYTDLGGRVFRGHSSHTRRY